MTQIWEFQFLFSGLLARTPYASGTSCYRAARQKFSWSASLWRQVL